MHIFLNFSVKHCYTHRKSIRKSFGNSAPWWHGGSMGGLSASFRIYIYIYAHIHTFWQFKHYLFYYFQFLANDRETNNIETVSEYKTGPD